MPAPHTAAHGVSPGGGHVCGHQAAPKVSSTSTVTLPLSRPPAGRPGAPRTSRTLQTQARPSFSDTFVPGGLRLPKLLKGFPL